jgi:hypothetical protein
MKTPESESALTFHWPQDQGFPFVLFACVVGSLLVHAATFFLFQVVYPQRVTIPQPAPQVSLLTPSSPENVAFLRWIEAEDPALVASDNSVNPAAMPEVRYRPSYVAPRTAPLGAPAEMPQAVRFPPAEDRLAPAESTMAAPPPPTASAPQPTTVSFSGALAARPLARHPALIFPQHPTAPAGPTGLLVGVNGDGEIRHTFLQESSGDSALDDLALDHLRHLVFAPANDPITWAFVTFVWGSDAYATQSPKSE